MAYFDGLNSRRPRDRKQRAALSATEVRHQEAGPAIRRPTGRSADHVLSGNLPVRGWPSLPRTFARGPGQPIDRGAERLEFSAGKTSVAQAIHTRARPDDEFIVAVSRSHLDAQTEAYVKALPHTRRLVCGSSLKFCWLAEGLADHYPRLGPTHDWDLAAGHAILTAAGGRMTDPDGTPLIYGTKEFLIPAFLAWGCPAPDDDALKLVSEVLKGRRQ